VVTATQQRAAAEYLRQEYEVSQRRAGAVLGRARSTLCYTPRGHSEDQPLIQAIRRLARKHLRWGYRRIHARLEKLGWTVNLKRVHRLWQELGLRRTVRRKPENKLGPKPGTSANSCVNQPARFKNDVWTYDFIADRTACGRTLKWLTLVDEYTRACLALRVDDALTGADVRGVLARVIGRRGAPKRIRSDNGSEFICEALSGWLPRQGTEPLPVAPGSP
jgi:putative transposase